MFNQYQTNNKDRHKEIENLIACAERELKLRRHVYPNLVARGKKTPKAAEYKIKCMKKILVILHLVNRRNFLEQPQTKTERMIFENTRPEMKND